MSLRSVLWLWIYLRHGRRRCFARLWGRAFCHACGQSRVINKSVLGHQRTSQRDPQHHCHAHDSSHKRPLEDAHRVRVYEWKRFPSKNLLRTLPKDSSSPWRRFRTGNRRRCPSETWPSETSLPVISWNQVQKSLWFCFQNIKICLRMGR